MSTTFTTNTMLMCPHGGTVKVTPKSQKVTIDGAVVVTTGDTWVVQGCSFVNPATKAPQPCTKVVWTSGDKQVKVSDTATISDASLGMCVGSAAPGPPSMTQNQNKVQSK